MTDIHDALTAALPKLRIYALSLTRDRTAAEDLVQEVAVKVLASADTFGAGSSFMAWSYRIMRNHFISTLRRHRLTGPITPDVENEACYPAHQEHGIVLREVTIVMKTMLNADQRAALLLAALEGLKIDDIAERTGVARGTVKSRMCRARDVIEAAVMPVSA